ncbi:MAG: UPF0147 family protein [Nanobdellota archaeon]
MRMSKLEEVVDALDELLEDNTVPKNVKIKIQSTKSILTENSEVSLKVNKALNELDELTDDTNLEPYTRTQLWNIVSMLEMI